MFSFDDYIRLRFVLLLGALAALSPALVLRRLGDDPFQDTSWWPHGTHSGVFVVFASAIIGCVVVFVLMHKNAWRWWSGALSGAVVGAMPGVIYWLGTPDQDMDWVPFGELFFVGMSRGLLLGVAMYFSSRDKETVSGA